MASVQFYGISDAVEAYNKCEVPAWGLFTGKQLICKFTGNDIAEGAELLQQFCEKISYSNATYTLKVYEADSKKEVVIKEKTECDLSFNFKLCEVDEYSDRREARGGGSRSVNDRLGKIEALLAGSDDDDETEPTTLEGSLMSGINSVLSDPEMIKGIIAGLFGIRNTGQPAAIAGVPQDQQLQQAIEILKRNDPKLPEHLAKLANISENEKATYNYLVGMLDKM